MVDNGLPVKDMQSIQKTKIIHQVEWTDTSTIGMSFLLLYRYTLFQKNSLIIKSMCGPQINLFSQYMFLIDIEFLVEFLKCYHFIK